jgi:hypothetical protein
MDHVIGNSNLHRSASEQQRGLGGIVNARFGVASLCGCCAVLLRASLRQAQWMVAEPGSGACGLS